MDNSINNRQPGYAGVNITCNVIDPTKLPPDSPLLRVPPQCTVDNGQQQYSPCVYPGAYYMNNYNNPYMNQPKGNTKKVRVKTLNDNYIKNLETCLNNPNKELRKSAADEVFKRLSEDKTRHNDAALNALLNKMLQDPTCHEVKASALIALELGMAQGNQNTVKILENMAKNDKSRDGKDALRATKILLKISAPTKLVDVPVNPNAPKNLDFI